MANKLKLFLMGDESDSTDEVGAILDAMLKLNKVKKFKKS